MDSRSEERVQLVYVLRLFETDSGELFGHLVNVNPGGIIVVGERKLEPGSTFRLVMDLPHLVERGWPIRFTSEVLWCEPLLETEYFRTGMRLLNLSVRDREELKRISREFKRDEIGDNIPEEMTPREIIEGRWVDGGSKNNGKRGQ